MERITENTIKVVELLQSRAKVGWVNDAGLSEQPDHALARKCLGGKPQGVRTFGVRALNAH